MIQRSAPSVPKARPARSSRSSISLQVDTPRVLLTGTVGTGKTTELLRVIESRKGKEFVVFVDLQRHFVEVVRDAEALQRIQAWEVCFLACVALIAEAQESLGQEFPKEHIKALEEAWGEAAKATDTPPPAGKIEIPKLAKAMFRAGGALLAAATGPASPVVLAGLATAEAVADSASWTLPIGRGKRGAFVARLDACRWADPDATRAVGSGRSEATNQGHCRRAWRTVAWMVAGSWAVDGSA